MPVHQSIDHIDDEHLLRGIDGELSPRDQVTIDDHLTSCEDCRARRDQLAQAGEVVSGLYLSRGESMVDASAQARRRLQSRLASLAAEPRGFWPDRVLGTLQSRSWVLSGAALGAAALLVALIWPAGALSERTHSGQIVEQGSLPTAAFTPGATWMLSADELCAGKRQTGLITSQMRQQVLRNYDMEDVSPDEYELDYLITPELGGATDARNLWPQRYVSRTWNARVKDELEHLLPQLVCSGHLDLETAQHDMAVNWIAAYRKYFGTRHPLRQYAAAPDDQEPLPTAWVGRHSAAPRARLVAALTIDGSVARTTFTADTAEHAEDPSLSVFLRAQRAPR